LTDGADAFEQRTACIRPGHEGLGASAFRKIKRSNVAPFGFQRHSGARPNFARSARSRLEMEFELEPMPFT